MSGFLLGAGGRSDLISGGAFANNGGAIDFLKPQISQHCRSAYGAGVSPLSNLTALQISHCRINANRESSREIQTAIAKVPSGRGFLHGCSKPYGDGLNRTIVLANKQWHFRRCGMSTSATSVYETHISSTSEFTPKHTKVIQAEMGFLAAKKLPPELQAMHEPRKKQHLDSKRHVGHGGTKGNRVHAQHNENLVGAIWYRQKTIIRDCDRGDELVVLQKAENSFVGFHIRVVRHLLHVCGHRKGVKQGLEAVVDVATLPYQVAWQGWLPVRARQAQLSGRVRS
jgi:hypothetical protein